MITRLRAVRPISLASLGALLLVLALGSTYLTLGVLRYDPWREYTTARLLVARSGGLGTGAPVLLTGIRVGEVTAVRRSTTGAEVEFRFSATHRIPADSLITIENLSALGEPYLEFAPKAEHGPYISDHQVLDTARTPVSIPEVSTRVVKFIQQLDPAAIGSLVHTVDTALAGTDTEIPRLEHATTLLAATLLSRTDTIRQLLADLQTTGADMEWTGPALAESGPKWAEFGDKLNQLIKSAGTVFDQGDIPKDYLTGDGIVPVLHLLDGLVGKLGPSLAELAPVLAPMVAQSTTALGRLDIGALITQALGAVGDDAIRLHITTK